MGNSEGCYVEKIRGLLKLDSLSALRYKLSRGHTQKVT